MSTATKATRSRTFGARLRALRAKEDETHYALGKRTGIDPGYLADVEAGRRDVGWAIACKIADAYGVSLDLFRKGSAP